MTTIVKKQLVSQPASQRNSELHIHSLWTWQQQNAGLRKYNKNLTSEKKKQKTKSYIIKRKTINCRKMLSKKTSRQYGSSATWSVRKSGASEVFEFFLKVKWRRCRGDSIAAIIQKHIKTQTKCRHNPVVRIVFWVCEWQECFASVFSVVQWRWLWLVEHEYVITYYYINIFIMYNYYYIMYYNGNCLPYWDLKFRVGKY